MITRRGFIGSILASMTAPAFVRAEILMPVRELYVPFRHIVMYDIVRDAMIMRVDLLCSGIGKQYSCEIDITGAGSSGTLPALRKNAEGLILESAGGDGAGRSYGRLEIPPGVQSLSQYEKRLLVSREWSD